MKLIPQITLQWKILGSFLLCAMITMISAGGGLYSLGEIHALMQKTTSEIDVSIENQNKQLRRLMPLRSLAISISKAKNLEELKEKEEELGEKEDELRKTRDTKGDDLKKIQDTMDNLGNLVAHKRRQLNAVRELSSLTKTNLETLKEANLLMLAIVEEAEANSAKAINEALAMKSDETPKEISDAVSGSVKRALSTIRSAMVLRSSFHELNVSMKDVLMTAHEESVTKDRIKIITLIDSARQNELLATSRSEMRFEVAKKLDKLQTLTVEMFDAVRITLAANSDMEKGSGNIRKELGDLDNQVIEAAASVKSGANKRFRDSAEKASHWKSFQIGISVIIIFMAFTVGVFTSSSAKKKIEEITEGMVNSIRQVAEASREFASINQHLVTGASRQADSLKKTSSSLEEIMSWSRENEENLNRVNDIMNQTSQVINRTSGYMVELTESIREISNTSEEIKNIIASIDEIAFQTSLLSLNAAVEAARAGEAGAGFAVVAGEVKKLADRSTDAAQDTAALAQKIIGRIEGESVLISKTDESFAGVSKSVRDVDELVRNVVSAFGRQASGIDDINRAVMEMENVVRQNMANVDKSVYAFNELNRQNDSMLSYIRVLKGLEEPRIFQRPVRAPIRVPGYIRFDESEAAIPFTTKNLSVGGALIATGYQIQTGVAGAIEIDFQGRILENLKAEVIREEADGDGYIYALRFKDMKTKSTRDLHDFISEYWDFESGSAKRNLGWVQKT